MWLAVQDVTHVGSPEKSTVFYKMGMNALFNVHQKTFIAS